MGPGWTGRSAGRWHVWPRPDKRGDGQRRADERVDDEVAHAESIANEGGDCDGSCNFDRYTLAGTVRDSRTLGNAGSRNAGAGGDCASGRITGAGQPVEHANRI